MRLLVDIERVSVGRYEVKLKTEKPEVTLQHTTLIRSSGQTIHFGFTLNEELMEAIDEER